MRINRFIILGAVSCVILSGCSQKKADDNQFPSAVADNGFSRLVTTDNSAMIQPVGRLFPSVITEQPDPKFDQIKIEKSIMVPMRDGVRLATDIYTPVGGEAPFPAILMRLPYNKNTMMGLRHSGSPAHFFAGQGYAVVVQDMRGRFESEGLYTVSKSNREDGYDALEWISKQSWATGKIGTYGCSYLGENQVMQAAMRHPNHTAALPQGAGGGYGGNYRPFGAYQGGAFELASGFGWFWNHGTKIFYQPPQGISDGLRRSLSGQFKLTPNSPKVSLKEAFWHLPIIDIMKEYGGPVSDFEDFISRPFEDPYWDELGYVQDDDQFDVPAIHVNSWFDGTPRETTKLFNLFRENAVSDRGRNNQYMIMSPTAHCQSEMIQNPENAVIGELPVGDVRLKYMQIYLDWFDHWLKGEENGVLDMPKVQYYLMGANEWRSSEVWPLENTIYKKVYLHSGGKANSRHGDGTLGYAPPNGDIVDRYTYDPGNPAPSVGGPICCISGDDAAAGSYDQSDVELRDDVLVYTSPVLTRPADFVGQIDAMLYVSSSAKDTDFMVKLVDVHPDGKAYNIQEGSMRARYREGFEKKTLMEDGGVYPVKIEMGVTANRFLPGHRIRIEVSSSNFPRSDRNLNTGGNNYDETEWVVAKNVIYHSKKYPSHVILPMVKLSE